MSFIKTNLNAAAAILLWLDVGTIDLVATS